MEGTWEPQGRLLEPSWGTFGRKRAPTCPKKGAKKMVFFAVFRGLGPRVPQGGPKNPPRTPKVSPKVPKWKVLGNKFDDILRIG